MYALRKIPPLEKYFTVNIYAVIEAIDAAPITRCSPS
jgi:hypothetical protein